MSKEPKHTVESGGKTTQEAIKSALLKLGVDRDRVIVKILSEGKRGLYGMSGGKLAKVRVTLKE